MGDKLIFEDDGKYKMVTYRTIKLGYEKVDKDFTINFLNAQVIRFGKNLQFVCPFCASSHNSTQQFKTHLSRSHRSDIVKRFLDLDNYFYSIYELNLLL